MRNIAYAVGVIGLGSLGFLIVLTIMFLLDCVAARLS